MTMTMKRPVGVLILALTLLTAQTQAHAQDAHESCETSVRRESRMLRAIDARLETLRNLSSYNQAISSVQQTHVSGANAMNGFLNAGLVLGVAVVSAGTAELVATPVLGSVLMGTTGGVSSLSVIIPVMKGIAYDPHPSGNMGIFTRVNFADIEHSFAKGYEHVNERYALEQEKLDANRSVFHLANDDIMQAKLDAALTAAHLKLELLEADDLKKLRWALYDEHQSSITSCVASKPTTEESRDAKPGVVAQSAGMNPGKGAGASSATSVQ